MTINKALSIFNKSLIAKQQTIGHYVSYKDGYILIANDDGAIGCHHWFVASDGAIVPTNPLISRFSRSDIKKL